MDIYDYLQKEYLKVKNLFKQFKKANKQRRVVINAMIQRAMTVHMVSKQKTLYKELEAFSESIIYLSIITEYQTRIQNQIALINSMNVSTIEWKEEVLELEKIFNDHILIEENSLLNNAKKVLNSDEAWIIKNKMHDYKEKMLEEDFS